MENERSQATNKLDSCKAKYINHWPLAIRWLATQSLLHFFDFFVRLCNGEKNVELEGRPLTLNELDVKFN